MYRIVNDLRAAKNDSFHFNKWSCNLSHWIHSQVKKYTDTGNTKIVWVPKTKRRFIKDKPKILVGIQKEFLKTKIYEILRSRKQNTNIKEKVDSFLESHTSFGLEFHFLTVRCTVS